MALVLFLVAFTTRKCGTYLVLSRLPSLTADSQGERLALPWRRCLEIYTVYATCKLVSCETAPMPTVYTACKLAGGENRTYH